MVEVGALEKEFKNVFCHNTHFFLSWKVKKKVFISKEAFGSEFYAVFVPSDKLSNVSLGMITTPESSFKGLDTPYLSLFL